MNKLLKGGSIIVAGIILLLLLVTMCTVSVAPGYAGVVYNRMGEGVIDEQPLHQGWHLVAPWKSVTKYPVSTETAYYTGGEHEGRKSDDSISAGTKDGKTIKLDMPLAYHMDLGRLPQVFTKFRGQDVQTIEYGYMYQNSKRIVNDITTQYTMMDLVGDKRAEINGKIFIAIQKYFDHDGIIVETAGIGKAEPDEQTKQAIQAVVNAENQRRQADLDRQRAEIEAQKLVAQATGQAQAKKLEADAIAYYNAKVAQSTDERVVALEWVKKWNGVLPATMLGGGQGIMINLQK